MPSVTANKSLAIKQRSTSPTQAHPGSSQLGFVAARTPFNPVYRKPTCACGGTCPRCQRSAAVQRELTLSAPDDPLEIEADRIADSMTNAPDRPLAQRTGGEFPTGAGLRLQRKCACGGTPRPDGECEECRKKRLRLRRHTCNQVEPSGIPPIVHEVLGSTGQPLDTATRALMESRFGHDFRRVRIHSDSRSADSARAVNACAYTVDKDIVFGAGNYAPKTITGQQLLAHELAHVVQQSRGGSASPPPFPSTALEVAADAASASLVRGESVQVDGTSAPGLARQPLSLNQSLNPSAMSDSELAQEIALIQQWLRENPASNGDNGDRATLTNALAALEQETAGRHPEIAPIQQSGPGSAAPASVAAGVSVGGLGLSGPGVGGPAPPWVTGADAEAETGADAEAETGADAEAETGIEAEAETGIEAEAEVATGEVVTTGAIAVGVGALAGLAVLLYTSPTVSAEEERGMLEEAQQIEANRRQREMNRRKQAELDPSIDPLTDEPEESQNPCDFSPFHECRELGYAFGDFASAEADLATRHPNLVTYRGTEGSTSGNCFRDGQPRPQEEAKALGATHTTFNVPGGGDVASIVCCKCCQQPIPPQQVPSFPSRCEIVKEINESSGTPN
jgi:hypothetical protein